jgi:tripartite-type tricarboxylate transporter receptor subunit TctC
MKKVKVLLLAAVVLLAAGAVYAQNYPTKPIRIIVPSGTGGGLDLIARSVLARMADSLGKAIVVENRAGGGGDVGVETVAHAAPDGHTLILVSATYVVRAGMYKVPYDPVSDFTSVSQVSAAPYLFVVNASLPVKSVAELVAYAKSNPGKLNFGSPGNGSLVHLTGELFKASSGIEMIHVPYKGSGAAFTDLLANQIQLGILTLPAALPYVKSDKVRTLAVSSSQRVKVLPELPTMIESGIKNFDVTQWHALLAPKGTPQPIVERLNREVLKVLKHTEVAKQLASEGAEVVGSSPQQLDAFIKSEYEKWGKVIKQAGIRIE